MSCTRTPPVNSPVARSAPQPHHSPRRRLVSSVRRRTASLSHRGRSGSGSGSGRGHRSPSKPGDEESASDDSEDSSFDRDSVVPTGQMEDGEVHELFCEMSALELDEDAPALSTSSSDYSWVEGARCALSLSRFFNILSSVRTYIFSKR